jgi:hypothetical protein
MTLVMSLDDRAGRKAGRNSKAVWLDHAKLARPSNRVPMRIVNFVRPHIGPGGLHTLLIHTGNCLKPLTCDRKPFAIWTEPIMVMSCNSRPS